MDRRIVIVANLPYRVKKHKVWKFFETFGTVTDVHLAMDNDGKLFGFVKFSDPSGASNAIEADNTDSLVLCGRNLRASPAFAVSDPSCESPVRAAAADDTGETGLVSPISQLPDELLEQILTQLPLATQLGVQRVCSQWRAVVDCALERLQVLDLRQAFGYIRGLLLETDGALSSLLRRTPNLRRFIIGGYTHNCSKRALAAVGRLCPHLVEVNLNSFNIDQRLLMFMQSLDRQSQMFHIPSIQNFTDASVCVMLTKLPQLQRLHLNACYFLTGEFLRRLPASLQVLNVADCRWLEADHLAALTQRQLPLLHELNISHVPLTDDLCRRILSVMPSLVTLRLSGHSLAFDQCLAPVAGQLLHLDLSRCTIKDVTLRQLAPQLQQLRSLVLDSCVDLTPAGLCHVTAAPHLSRLSLSLLPAVDGTVLRSLASMALTEISLAENHRDPAAFTGEDLQHLIVNAGQLQVLDLSEVSLLTLDLLKECAEKRVQMADSVATRDALSCLVVKAGGTAVTLGPSGCMFVVKEDSQPHCPRLELLAMHVVDFNSVPFDKRKLDEEDMDDSDKHYSHSDDLGVYEEFSGDVDYMLEYFVDLDSTIKTESGDFLLNPR